MGVEQKGEYKLPEDALGQIAEDLFGKFLLRLSENKGLRDALTKRYLTNPQGRGFSFESGKIEFQNESASCGLSLENSPGKASLRFRSTIKKIQEEVEIGIYYKEEFEGPCKMFEGARGPIDTAHISFMRFDWNRIDKTETYTNSTLAVSKAREFLHHI